MAQFVQNFFACCGTNPELDKSFRASNASSLQYSFIAVPNENDPNIRGEGNRSLVSFPANPLDEENADFKSSSFKSEIMEEDPDPDADLRDEYADFERDETDALSV